jgi:hypothetical protein
MKTSINNTRTEVTSVFLIFLKSAFPEIVFVPYFWGLRPVACITKVF